MCALLDHRYSIPLTMSGHAEKAVTAIDKERRNSYDSMQCDVEGKLVVHFDSQYIYNSL